MADKEIIREFLVQLGFQVDGNKQKQFVDAIATTTVKVVALGAAAAAAADMVVASVERMAEGLENLYFASQRTKASAENIQAFGFAARQMGADAGAAQSAIESLARFIRNNPGGEGLLKSLGVQTRDANGGMRDTVDMLGQLGQKFASMPYYRANAYAQALGIDEKTLMAMREGMGEFQQQYKDMLRAAGLDLQSASKQSHGFMSELRLLGGAFDILEKKIITGMQGKVTDGIRHSREMLVKNFDRISNAAGVVLTVLGKIADVIVIMTMRGMQAIGWLIDKFDALSPGAKKIIEIIGGIALAWRILNKGFLASPLGRIMALVSIIALLWDDYQTWKEGGKSLIDWSAWSPGIEAAIDGLKRIGGAIHEGLSFLGDWRPALELVLAYVTGKWLFGMLGAFRKVGAAQAALGGAKSLGRAGALGAAGALGYGAGTLIYDNFLEGTSASDAIGRFIAKGAAALGSKDAQEALARESAAQAARRSGGGSVSDGSQPRGIRNNNPGNIEYGEWARAHGATGKEAAGRFARFGNAQDGLNALADLLRNYMGRGIDTIGAIIAKYAPASENNTAAYVASVAKRLGVSPTAHLDPRNVAQMAGMVDAIVRVENGKNPYSAEMVNLAAARGVGLTQSTTITVHASGDAKAIAQETASAQNNVNGQLVRNLRGAVF